MTKETVTIKKDSMQKSIIAALAILLVISIFTGGFQKSSENDKNIKQPSEETDIPSINMKNLMDDDSINGDPNAVVTIVEFSDYECPFCARFYNDAYQQIKSEYIDTGKIKMIFRDFPLGFHKNAQKAAEAAECAGDQDKYYEMHDQLFENGVTGGVESFKEYAKIIGLDQNQFDECLDSGENAKEVQDDFKAGQAAGVKGTPAFFINGELISGAQPFSVFKEKIDAYL